jgi:hypothetical protein
VREAKGFVVVPGNSKRRLRHPQASRSARGFKVELKDVNVNVLKMEGKGKKELTK